MQTNVLNPLKDIQTPEPIGWWPFAWGWYVLALLVIVSVYYLVIAIRKRIRANQPKKQALALMSDINQQPLPQQTVTAINNVLKRVMLVYLPREDTAQLSGKAWATLLNDLVDEQNQIDSRLIELAYKPKCSAKDADAYFKQAKNWIEQALPLNNKQLAIVEAWRQNNV